VNIFDKICAVVAGLLGIVLLILGVVGLITGCRFWFTLPPILGVLPAFAGWGIVRSVYFGWKYKPPAAPEPAAGLPLQPFQDLAGPPRQPR